MTWTNITGTHAFIILNVAGYGILLEAFSVILTFNYRYNLECFLILIKIHLLIILLWLLNCFVLTVEDVSVSLLLSPNTNKND